MAWVESHTVLRRHRKTIGLARDLKICPEWAMGHLHALWHDVLEQQEDGDLSSWTDDMIADAGGFKGDPAKVVGLLLKHKWLDDSRTLHDWLDYTGLYLIRKYSSGKNKDKLIEIWAKHGRTYGEQKLNTKRTVGEQKLNLPNPPNQTEPTHQPRSEVREFLNPGYPAHAALVEKAARLVRLYLERTRTTYKGTASPAERFLAQLFLDEPAIDIAAIENGIAAYARECEAASSKACGPGPFFEKRMWESYRDFAAVEPQRSGDNTHLGEKYK